MTQNAGRRLYKLVDWIYMNCGEFDDLIYMIPALVFFAIVYWVLRAVWHKWKFRGDFREIRKQVRLNEMIKLLLMCWCAFLALGLFTKTGFWHNFWLSLANNRDPFRFENNKVPFVNLMPLLLGYILNGHIDWFFYSLDSLLPHLAANIALFVPYGLAIKFVYKKATLLKTALSGLLISSFIEIIQHFIGRDSDIDDVICNTLGAVIGYLLYLLIKKLFPNFTEKGKQTANDIWIGLRSADRGT